MTNLFAEIVILGTALEKSLHYSVPEGLDRAIFPGSIVSVELGRRKTSGVVLSAGTSKPDLPENVKIRPILHILPEILPEDLLQLCRWISDYYFYPLGEVLALAVPGSGMPKRKVTGVSGKKIVLLAGVFPEQKSASQKVREIRALLEQFGSGMDFTEFRKVAGKYWVDKLLREGTIKIEVSEEDSDPSNPSIQNIAPVELTAEQNDALAAIWPYVENPSFQPFVLYGVTGSGKTEIYMRLVEVAARSGKGSLILVPEIALSTQMEAIFRGRFGAGLAVWHSSVSQKERLRQRADIISGRTNIVLGARSAVLSAIRQLGLIIVDEEHEPAYKQEDRLRYNARDVALMRAKFLGIPVVLGSATPSLQTLHNCESGAYRTVSLPSRIFGRPMPDIEIVDMKREGARGGVFSAKLREAIQQVLNDGLQAMIFLNRRGFAKNYLCSACGHILQCISCSLTLTYHKDDNCLRCHYCGWETALPERCPSCSHAALFSHGYGTERVEKEIGRLFPSARTVRVDRDTMNSSEKLREALSAVRSRRANVLLGTQMIAKGHDFPNITLVGVINADVGLQANDFRAGENLVQLLFQVAGRAGRGEEPGRVIVQTYNPFHYTIDSLLKMDYDGFCRQELESRKTLQYPPYTRLLKFLVTGRNEQSARVGAQVLAAICREKSTLLKESGKHVAVLGPSPAAYVKLKNRFRWQVFIKAWDSRTMQDFARMVLETIHGEQGLREVMVTVDRDPANEM